MGLGSGTDKGGPRNGLWATPEEPKYGVDSSGFESGEAWADSRPWEKM